MKIVCVGRNYALHAQELGNAVPTEPVLFLKPETALLPAGEEAAIPAFTNDLHYECELVVRIGRKAQNVTETEAGKHIEALTLGIDFTARDLQDELKKKGLPWERAKAFDGSAAVGHFLPAGDFEDLQDLRFALSKNGKTVQKGHTGDMIFSIAALLSYVSRYFTLLPGDLLFTGTPAGVGPVAAGDILEGTLNEKALLRVSVARNVAV